MFYIVFALILVVIGVVDLDPLLTWIEERNLPDAAASAAILISMGLIPATIVGLGILADTYWRGERRGK